MKANSKNSFLLPALIAVLNLLPADLATAQTFTTVYSFTYGDYDPSSNASTNSDGANPRAGLILSGGTLYGTTEVGGRSGRGAVFAVNPNGTGFTNLHSFTATSGSGGYFGTNSDGASPSAGLITNSSGNTLYGTATGGGRSGYGSVFAVNTDGTEFTNLHSFTALSSVPLYGTNNDGAYPSAGLILSNNTLYGTASQGGPSGYGTVFAVNSDGTGFTNLHNFAALDVNYYTNSDGAFPLGGLILSGHTLYGTAYNGGSLGYGTVFAVNTDGTGFTNLHSFTGGSDGARPWAGLILSGNTLYGTTLYTVFAVNTDGTGYTNLHRFTGFDDGGNLKAGLILSGNTLFGTASEGGSLDEGTMFAVNTDGTGFTNLYSFTYSDGANPWAGLILSGNSLFGTAKNGGDSGGGTVFSLSFRPQLTITRSGTNVILSWPTNVAGFDYTGYTLQSATNLGSPVWSTNSPAPVVIAGQNTVTNPITGAQQFYRLSH